jgi:hypothetical protein
LMVTVDVVQVFVQYSLLEDNIYRVSRSQ